MAAMAKKTKNEHDDKVFVIDKAVGPTSFAVVAAMRRAVGLRKVGHAGTLDPLAHGVLLVCTGMATRAVEHLMNLEKEYAFTVRLGVETTTLDVEGDVVREAPVPDIPAADLKAAAASFVGRYSLVPPRFSAVKQGGKRMYEMARNGESQDPAPRNVNIYSFDIAGVDLPDVHCVVRCSRGTYVRSLARDLGEKLGTAGHVAALARTRIGPFEAKGAFPSQSLEARDIDALAGYDLDHALEFLPGVVLSSRSRKALAYGALPGQQDVVETIGEVAPGAIRLLDEHKHLLAVGRRGDDEARNRLCIVDSFRLFVDPASIRGGEH
jgi:tRNA pseudouridine55 synthase